MNAELARIRDDYLARLRRALRRVTPDVAGEAEQEIRAHIEDALAARETQTVGALLDVLERLGPPEEYAPDVALYMMVDRGYRDWSLRHMIGSARFWALSTAAGAIVVLIFGLLYALVLAAIAAGIQQAVADLVRPDGGAYHVLPGVATWPLLTVGPAALLALTAVLRWFIGQYVQRARPMGLGGDGGEDGEGAWARQTQRAILTLALIGLVVTVVGGLLAQGLRFEQSCRVYVDSAALRSPMALVGYVGLALFFLAPVIGLILGLRVRDGDRAF
ncbi:MAG: hypothetical protein ABI780_09030 [Ardenticatenales bacterium]